MGTAAKLRNNDSISLYACVSSDGDFKLPGGASYCIVGDEKSQVGIAEDSGDSYQTGSTSGHHTNIFPGIFALLALTVVFVV